MDPKTLMHSSAGVLRSPEALVIPRKGATANLGSLGARYGVSDPRNRVCFSSASIEDGKTQLTAIEIGITDKLGYDRAKTVLKPLRALVDCAKGTCEVEIVLSKLDLSEPVLSVTVRVPTLQSEMPLALLDNVASLLPGLRFSLSTSNRKSEYVTGLGEEQGVKTHSLPDMLSNLARVVEYTRHSRLA